MVEAFVTAPPSLFKSFVREGVQRMSRQPISCTSVQNGSCRKKDIDIASVGNLCLDVMLPISKYPVKKGEHQLLRDVARMELGGSMNALISARRLGANVAPVAYIGDQDGHPSDAMISDYVLQSSLRLGLCTDALVRRKGAFVQTCVAMYDPPGEHTFLASNELPEHNVESEAAAASETMLDIVARSAILIVDGFAIHSDRQLVDDTVTKALENDTEIWIDPQSASKSLLDTGDALFRVMMAKAKGISLTMDETLVLTQTKDLEAAIRVLGQEWCPEATTFLIKDGVNGSHVATKTADGPADILSVPAFTIGKGLYRDSIGAGDSFLGAFLAGKTLLGMTPRESGMLANAMGASTCMNHGAGDSGIGTLQSVRELLDDTAVCAKLPSPQVPV